MVLWQTLIIIEPLLERQTVEELNWFLLYQLFFIWQDLLAFVNQSVRDCENQQVRACCSTLATMTSCYGVTSYYWNIFSQYQSYEAKFLKLFEVF